MKYIVEVNAKWLVSIEAEGLGTAEHKVLDLDGIWGALAFDREMMKTDTFAGAVQGCEMISMDELAKLSCAYDDAYTLLAAANDKAMKANDEVARLKELLQAAEAERLDAQRELNDAKCNADKAHDKLGRERR